MSTGTRRMTKSPVRLAREAMRIGGEGLPAYSAAKSPKKFTQPQLFAILVLRQFFKTDYRGIVQILADMSDLREALALKQTPHYSTLCYAEQRLLKRGSSKACLLLYSSAHAS
jgi:hypothetical protein